MKDTNKIRSLTWKYFIRQKIIEVIGFVSVACAIVFVPYLLGLWMNPNTELVIIMWGVGFLTILMGAILLFFLIGALVTWLSSNWKKAKEKARKEARRNN